MDSQIIGLQEAAKLLEVSTETVLAWEKEGKLKSRKSFYKQRFKREDVLKLKSDQCPDIRGTNKDFIPLEKEEKLPFMTSEAQLIFERWNKLKDGMFFKDLPEELKKPVAVMLENQRLINEVSNTDGSYNSDQFKRLSIPIVRRIFGQTILHKIVSIQPMLGPTSLIYDKNRQSQAVTAQSKKLQTCWSFEAQQDLRSVNNLDAEQELLSVMAHQITAELQREIIQEIYSKAAHSKSINVKYCKRSIKELLMQFLEENRQTFDKPQANWIIVGPEVADLLASQVTKDEVEVPADNDCAFTSCLAISHYITLKTDKGNIEVYKDPLFQIGKILTGYRGTEPTDAGFVWAPYIMFNLTPVVLDPDSFCPRRRLIYRGAEIVTDPTYFATLTLQGIEELFKKQDDLANCMKKEIQKELDEEILNALRN